MADAATLHPTSEANMVPAAPRITRSLPPLVLSLLAVSLYLMCAVPSAALEQPTVFTDRIDYSPGDTVIVAGGGWAPGETVLLTFEEYPVQHPFITLATTSDADGSIRSDEYVIEDHDLGTMFVLTASGQTSGLTAQTTFTDSPKVGSVSVALASGSVCAGSPGSVSYTVTVTRGSGGGSSGSFTALLSAATPDGVSASFSPNPVSFAPGSTVRMSTLTLTTDPWRPAGSIGITVKAATSVNDFATGTASLTVNQSPTITPPADISVSNDPGQCGAAVAFWATTTGSPSPTITYSTEPGSLFPIGVTTVTATAANSCGTATATFHVTVRDTQAPAIATGNLARSTYPGLCTASISSLGTSATDNCAVASLVGTRSDGVALGAPFAKGVTTITWLATDISGNTTSATQSVTVADNEPPTLTPPAALSLVADPGATACGLAISDEALGAPTATDNCDVTVTRGGVPPGNFFPVGATTITYTATDPSGHSVAATQLVTVVDNTPPALTPPPSLTLATGPGATVCVIAVSDASLGQAVASDNCSATVTRAGVPEGHLFPVGSTTLTYTATDASGNQTTSAQTVTVVDNTPPTIASADVVKATDAGRCDVTIFSLGTTAADNCGLASLVGTRGDAAPLTDPFPKGTTTIAWVAADASGNTTTATQTVTVTNGAPTVAITAPASGQIVAVGTLVNFSGSVADDSGDLQTARWICDGVSYPAAVDPSSHDVSGAITFTAAGVYLVSLEVTDQCGQSGRASQVAGLDAIVVVYDPSAGFVTGGGWINSPPGAYPANPSLTDKANFGFVSKYKKGATAPTGDTEFQFKAGDLNFRSTSYQWLVVSGARAQFKGSGTINAAGDFAFLLSAVDGQVNGGGGKDKFRIKITDKATGSTVYDSQLGAPDSSTASTLLGGGSVVIHTSSGYLSSADSAPDEAASSDGAGTTVPAADGLFQNSPNPFNPETRIRFATAENGPVTLRVFNARGALVRTLVNQWLHAGGHLARWNGNDENGRPAASGAYYARLTTARGSASHTRMLLVR